MLVIGQELECEMELSNPRDPYAVKVIHRGNVVGHVRRIISTIFSMFWQLVVR